MNVQPHHDDYQYEPLTGAEASNLRTQIRVGCSSICSLSLVLENIKGFDRLTSAFGRRFTQAPSTIVMIELSEPTGPFLPRSYS